MCNISNGSNHSIYRIVNKVNGFSYIGKTCKSIYERFDEHIYNAWCNINRPLYNAMNEYGFDKFEIYLLESGLSSNSANVREVFYIDFYNTYIKSENSKGYNATPGGDGGSSNSKKVVQIDIDNKSIVSIFESTREAGRCLGKKNAHISEACRHERKGYLGYIWLYYDEYKNIVSNLSSNETIFDYLNNNAQRLNTKGWGRCIAMENIHNGEVRLFKSMADLVKDTGLHDVNVYRVLRGDRKSHRNCRFYYI